MPISKKASRRRTSPNPEAASKQTAAGRAERRKAASAAAKQTQNVRHFAQSGTQAIQAHTQARGQRKQARRDSGRSG
jgi:hypothetical protein